MGFQGVPEAHLFCLAVCHGRLPNTFALAQRYGGIFTSRCSQTEINMVSLKRAIAMSKNITAKLQQMLSSLRAKVRAPIVCPNCGEKMTGGTIAMFHMRENRMLCPNCGTIIQLH